MKGVARTPNMLGVSPVLSIRNAIRYLSNGFSYASDWKKAPKNPIMGKIKFSDSFVDLTGCTQLSFQPSKESDNLVVEKNERRSRGVVKGKVVQRNKKL